ncbi:hypothetical protein EYE42_05940 [Paracoccus subflavus]|uniref:Uncharacterized protein n=1 Tax=Paracoccus subflavus TaxID=2528244 RepID=A0A4Q9G259_9RHOB|nr:hypothetical protein [Paracoccus subflavus]TBN41939.1 hypothetical protein EYE42_05940 [Paracoccus subflavus]
MTEDHFTIRRRLREARAAVRNNKVLRSPAKQADPLFSFFEDLALAFEVRDVEEDEVFHHVIRCMASVARHYAEDAYQPYGLTNPFKPAMLPPPQPTQESKRSFIWPVINPNPPKGAIGPGGIIFDHKYSALKMFGYTVGTTKGWDLDKRKHFLSDFIELELPTIVEKTFGISYGAPSTMQRLLKVANVIASNANLKARHDAHLYRRAIRDWQDDLNFLKGRYYDDKHRIVLAWPKLEGRDSAA